MKNKLSILIPFFLLAVACAEDPAPNIQPEQASIVIENDVRYTSTLPDADQSLTIQFKATSTSPLYGYEGDLYLHAGVISEGTWRYVPAKWETNVPKCKMTQTGANVWTITLSPSIRQWFASGETPVKKLGVVIRSADRTRKGVDKDLFINVTDTKYNAFQPAAIVRKTLPSNVRHGINIIDDKTVTLVLYDKDTNGSHKDFAHIIGDFNGWKLSNDEKSQMFRDDAASCWWITLTGLDADKEYAFQYYVGMKDGDPIRLADAYSRKILDPDNDKYILSTTYPNLQPYPSGAIGIASVFQIKTDVYNWKVTDFNAPDASELVIYEMLFRDFTPSGDINGAMEKLDYLQSLGVNAIELMPVQEFDGNNSWGYNPCFYFAMDKAYGTDRMYKEFIDACHERGMAVIFDVVYNHATGANPFAKLYWNASANKTAANNPWFNVDAPHPYSVFHDFNHESSLVRDFVKRNLQFLLEEYNIDGFRFDLTKGFTQNRNGNATNDNGNYDASRVAILKDYNAAIKTAKADAYVILEHFCDNQEETELGNAGMMLWRNLNNAYCQSGMGYKENSDFSNLYYTTSSRPANSLVGYMESHDEERVSYKQTQWGVGTIKTDLATRMDQLKANAAFFFTVPGPKMIWQFGELGYDISINADPTGTAHDDDTYRTARKPVKWEYAEVPQRKGLYETYATLIGLRRSHSELFNSTSTLDWKVSENDWEKGRFLTLSSLGNAKQIVVVGNFTNTAMKVETAFPKTGTWYNYRIPSETLTVTSSTASLTVPANDFLIYTSFSKE